MIKFLLSVHSFFRYALVVIYLGGIVALSLLPTQDLPKVELFRGADKAIHFTMYLIFSVLSCWALKTEIYRSRIWFIIPITIGWGMFMELMQLEMRVGRSFSWYDMLANSLGVLLGISIYALASRYAKLKN